MEFIMNKSDTEKEDGTGIEEPSMDMINAEAVDEVVTEKCEEKDEVQKANGMKETKNKRETKKAAGANDFWKIGLSVWRNPVETIGSEKSDDSYEDTILDKVQNTTVNAFSKLSANKRTNEVDTDEENTQKKRKGTKRETGMELQIKNGYRHNISIGSDDDNDDDYDYENKHKSFFEIFDTVNDFTKKKKKQQVFKKKTNTVVSEKAWHDSDDENQLTQKKTGNDEIDQYPFQFADEEEQAEANILLENEENPLNIFEKYIENCGIELFGNEAEQEDSQPDETIREHEALQEANMISEDVFIYNEEMIRMDISKRKGTSGKCQNNIYLPYRTYKFNSKKIKEKSSRQLITIPKENLIMPIYKDSIYVLQFKDAQLDVLKKIKFKIPLRHAEEYNGNVYLLGNDNFVRTFNLEKGAVYKNRLNIPRDNSYVHDIRFFTDRSDKHIEDAKLFSLSFLESGKINLYDYRTLDTTTSFLMNHNYVGMNFHINSNTLITMDKSGYLYKWCLRTNRLMYKLMDNYTVFPSCLNVYKDYLVTCACNGFLNLFHIDNPTQPLKSFKNITQYVKDAVFSQSHDYLLYYSQYATNGAKLIDLKANYIYCNFPLQNKRNKFFYTSANFFNNGNTICLADKNNSFHIYDLQN